MLPKDSIASVRRYYAENPQYQDDFHRAIREFFDKPKLKRGDKLETNGSTEGLFNEWFLYNFVLKNGHTVLQDFIIENPFGLDFVAMQLYRDILEHAHYGLFEAMDVVVGKGMTITDVYSGQTWNIQEVKGTYQVHKGDVFFHRVGKVGNHYEFIGANSFSLGQLTDGVKDHLRSSPAAWTPKEANMLLQMRLS